jgi:glutamine amidotransferase/cyclase
MIFIVSLSFIARYGRQAVVISVDPKRVYVTNETDTKHATVKTRFPGPSGEKYCWYQCTVKGGREGRDLDVVELVVATELLGAGEILLNCMDRDGTKSGFDDELIRLVKDSVRIPVIASSGAGSSEHFARVFGVGPPGEIVNVESALAAGIFHRREVPLDGVKSYLRQCDIPVRNATAYTVCDTQ